MIDEHSYPVVLFDGVCNLCQGSVQWILKRDRAGRFRFASLQSDIAQQLLENFGYSKENFDSVVLIQNGKIFTKSDAALRIAQGLGGLWPLLSLFRVVPKFFRNAVYNWIARNRYSWFGKTQECWLPTPQWRNRFLE